MHHSGLRVCASEVHSYLKLAQKQPQDKTLVKGFIWEVTLGCSHNM